MGTDEEEWEYLLQPALDLSLLRYTDSQPDPHTGKVPDAEEQNILTLHRLVQEVIRAQMQPEMQREQAERVVQALCAAYPGAEFAARFRCKRLLPHWRQAAYYVKRYAITSAEAGALLNQIGYYLHERGQYAEAEPLYKQALEIHKQALPPDHPDIAQSLNNLAGLYRAQGHYEEAEPLYKQALEIDRVALGEQHPDYAIDLNNLAALYRAQGRYEEAEPLYKQALALFERALGTQHPNTQLVRRNLESFRQEAVLRTLKQQRPPERIRTERRDKPPEPPVPPRPNRTTRRPRPSDSG